MMLGFMQGRLSPMVDGRIQAFPMGEWREEFPRAQALGLKLMEWTLDHDGLAANPLMTAVGRSEIAQLSAKHGVLIPSVTGDCFMQAPFWKCDEDPVRLVRLLNEFDAVVLACAAAGIKLIVVPLVDQGRVETSVQEAVLREQLTNRAAMLRSLQVVIVFESDLPPAELSAWIARLPDDVFGINYDTGNSAALGYDPQEEWQAYGRRIRNVHVKDRLRGGTTVPLGEGACDFAACGEAVRAAGYHENFILQTARAADGDHMGALAKYREFWQRAWSAECRPSNVGQKA
jgi:hexulose-6-phosphate isomerase